MIYIDTNNPGRFRFEPRSTFYSTQVHIDGPLAARVLALQQVADKVKRVCDNLANNRMSAAQQASALEVLWQEATNVVGQLLTPDIAAGTSTPSPDNSPKQESRSSTKRKTIQSG